MATLALGIATSHIAMIVGAPENGDPAQVARFRAGYTTLARTLADAQVDALLVLSSDHVNKFFLDNMPAFCVGVFDSFAGPAEASTGIPTRRVPSDPALARHLLRHGLDHGIDWARAEEWVVDHGFMTPLYLLDGAARIPAVPIHVNCAAPPYPSPARCYAVGELLARAIADWTSPKRVAIVAAGGLSHSPGDERMGEIDRAFDQRFLNLVESGDGRALAALSDAEIEAAGSSTGEVRTWIVLAGALAGSKFQRIMYEPIEGFVTGCAQCVVHPKA
jgi:aromatic ring-opening dioxygenase catalytic subunit (LigB family)